MNENTILIWGAGAIGGTLGAYLARAGEDVLLVDIVEPHVEAMKRDGLFIEGPVETFRQTLNELGGVRQLRRQSSPYPRRRACPETASG